MSNGGAPSLVIESLGDVRALRGQWAELASASHNVFSTWEWTSVWWRHFGSGRSLDVWGVRDADGRTLALLPLTRERRGPLRIVRFAGHGVADELGRKLGILAVTTAEGFPTEGGDILGA